MQDGPPLTRQGFLEIGAARLEYRLLGPPPAQAPTIVLLHEGLGCVDVWGEFPERLQALTGLGVLAYSRAGYGRSSASKLPRAATFMHEEARDVLPLVLEAIGFRSGFLLGHSDGASIAAIYAGASRDDRLRGLILIAPHFFTEDMGIAEIERAKTAYEAGALRQKLAHLHRDVDNAFYNWCEPWLEPDFRKFDITAELAAIRAPILIVQGDRDQYGTTRQIAVARQQCAAPVEVALLPEVRHSPHREAADAVLRAAAGFVRHVLPQATNEQAGDWPQAALRTGEI